MANPITLSKLVLHGIDRGLAAEVESRYLWYMGPNRRAQERERADERKAAADAREVISRLMTR
jgi:hypothetical protein